MVLTFLCLHLSSVSVAVLLVQRYLLWKWENDFVRRRKPLNRSMNPWGLACGNDPNLSEVSSIVLDKNSTHRFNIIRFILCDQKPNNPEDVGWKCHSYNHFLFDFFFFFIFQWLNFTFSAVWAQLSFYRTRTQTVSIMFEVGVESRDWGGILAPIVP